jgi:hypothetical protein
VCPNFDFLFALAIRGETSESLIGLARDTSHIADRPSKDGGSAVSELHDRIETWVNEDGAGGKDDESAPRPRRGRQRHHARSDQMGIR